MARWIAEWHPDDPAFWEKTGKRVARRNLIFSIFAEHLGFTVWTLWSIVATKMGSYEFTTDQLFWLVALPNLIGSVLRVPYTFGPAKFGGRPLTFDSRRAAAAAAVLDPDLVIPAHYDGWAHFSEGLADLELAFHEAGLSALLRTAPHGTWTPLHR